MGDDPQLPGMARRRTDAGHRTVVMSISARGLNLACARVFGPLLLWALTTVWVDARWGGMERTAEFLALAVLPVALAIGILMSRFRLGWRTRTSGHQDPFAQLLDVQVQAQKPTDIGSSGSQSREE